MFQFSLPKNQCEGTFFRTCGRSSVHPLKLRSARELDLVVTGG
jgi:hypothetical protein